MSVEVYREPESGGYRKVTSHGDGAVLPGPVGAPDVDVTELLGPRG